MADRHVLIDDLQYVTPTEFENMQKFQAEALTRMVHDAVGDGSYYAGFAAVEDGAWGLDVAPGRLYLPSGIFRRAETVSFDFFQSSIRPVSQKKWVAIVGWGQSIAEDDIQNRQFLVSAQSDDTISKPTPLLKWNKAEIGHVLGSEAATPIKPAAAAGQVLIAYVLLSTGGIEQIVMVEENLVPQSARNALENIENRLWREQLGSQVDTLQTDLASLAEQVAGSVPLSIYQAHLADYAKTKETALQALELATQLDAAAPSFLFRDQDTFANEALSNTEADGYSARIDRGLRFPFDASNDTQSLDLVNPDDTRLSVVNDFALPAHDKKPRLSTWRSGMSQAEALNAFTNVTVTTKTAQRPIYATRAGAQYITQVEHAWAGGNYSGAAEKIIRNGVTYRLVDNEIITPAGVDNIQNYELGSYVSSQLVYAAASSKVITGHENYTFDHTETTDYVGQGRAQTWLQAQDGWCVGVDLYFSKIGVANDLRVMIMEAPGDEPEVTRILSEVTVLHSDLTVAGSTAEDGLFVEMPPHVHRAGKRLALALMSQGNHFIYVIPEGHAATGGAMYHLDANGRWQKATTDITIAMRLRYARFYDTTVAVDMKPLQLTNGFTGAEIWTETVILPATRMAYRLQIGGQWYWLGEDISPALAADLSGGEALLQMQAVFIGTRDLMPGVGLKATRSAITTSRAATILKHRSSVRTFGGSASTIKVSFRAAHWDPSDHVVDIDLLDGATVIEADTIEEIDLGNKVRQFIATFDVSGSPLTSAVVEINGTTANAENQFYGLERSLNAYAA